MTRTEKIRAGIAAAALVAIVLVVALVFSGKDRSIGQPVALQPPRAAIPAGVTGLHGPKGEPCIHTYAIPGANNHVIETSTTTVGNVIYTRTVNGTWIYRAGTKVPPAYAPLRTEHVCMYRPAP